LAAEFGPKFININELFTKSDFTQKFLKDFVKSSLILINLGPNWAAKLLPILSFPLNSEELVYSLLGDIKLRKKYENKKI
jgi:hypothetical protein